MPKRIIIYKLVINEHGNKSIPGFVSDGGYFIDSGSMIGVSKDDTDIYIPSDIATLSNQQFIDRIVSMSLQDSSCRELTADQKTDIANKWLNEKGFSS